MIRRACLNVAFLSFVLPGRVLSRARRRRPWTVKTSIGFAFPTHDDRRKFPICQMLLPLRRCKFWCDQIKTYLNGCRPLLLFYERWSKETQYFTIAHKQTLTSHRWFQCDRTRLSPERVSSEKQLFTLVWKGALTPRKTTVKASREKSKGTPWFVCTFIFLRQSAGCARFSILASLASCPRPNSRVNVKSRFWCFMGQSTRVQI